MKKAACNASGFLAIFTFLQVILTVPFFLENMLSRRNNTP